MYAHYSSKEDILVTICNLGISKLQVVINEVMTVLKFWTLVDSKEEGKFKVFNLGCWGFFTPLFRSVFPNEKEPCYVNNVTPGFFVSTLNSVPKYVDPNNIDLDILSEDIFKRFKFGFKGY